MTTGRAPSVEAMLQWCAAEEQRLHEAAPRLPFAVDEYQRRQTLLRGAMSTAALDTLLVTAPDSMCWLTGYDSRWYRSHSSTAMPPSQCVLMHADGALVHGETAAHAELVRLTSCAPEFAPIPNSGFAHEPTLAEFVAFVVEQFGARGWLPARIGIERWSATPNPATLGALERGLIEAGCEVVDVTALMRRARRHKSPAEIALIETAQSACDTGLEHLRDQLRPGLTELEAWSIYIAGVVAGGGEPTAMHETIAAGPPMPSLHLMSSRRVLGEGDYVNADVAAAAHRYHARATRMFWLGAAPAEVHRMTELAADALDVLVATAKVGMTFGELAVAMTSYFDTIRMPSWVGGYELGVSFPPDWVGEFCWSSTDLDCADRIEAGLVTNVESCVGDVAVVDTIVFEDSGPRLLSRLPARVIEVAP